MSEPKVMKVVSILTPYCLVINAGEEDGLKKGQRVLVYGLGDMILDPDTQEELEEVEIVRGTGKVIHVQRRIATVESDRTSERPARIIRKTNPMMFGGLGATEEESRIEREGLPFDGAQIGDLVRLERRTI